MKKSSGVLLVLGSALAGGIAGLLFAPQSGRRTRALVRDKSVKYSHGVADFTGKKSRHIANKAKGYAHDIRGFFGSRTSPEEIIEEVEEAAIQS
jgi:gas vesicle protein